MNTSISLESNTYKILQSVAKLENRPAEEILSEQLNDILLEHLQDIQDYHEAKARRAESIMNGDRLIPWEKIEEKYGL